MDGSISVSVSWYQRVVAELAAGVDVGKYLEEIGWWNWERIHAVVSEHGWEMILELIASERSFCLVADNNIQYHTDADGWSLAFVAFAAGANVNIETDVENVWILHLRLLWLCREGKNLEELSALLSNPGIPLTDCFSTAVTHNHPEVVKLLIADPRVEMDETSQNYNMLIHASGYGHVEVVRVLLEDGRIDPINAENGALSAAIRNGHPKVMELLLSDRRVRESNLFNVLYIAICIPCGVEHTKMLLDSGRFDNQVQILGALHVSTERLQGDRLTQMLAMLLSHPKMRKEIDAQTLAEYTAMIGG